MKLTRRAVLTGTAASSIAAIAASHGVAAAANDTLSIGFGDLEGGALGAFHKVDTGFGVFLKFENRGADVFYKDMGDGSVELFYKFFNKGWSSVTSAFLKRATSLDGADAYFGKVYPGGAEFFLKYENGLNVVTTLTNGEEGVDIQVSEFAE